MFVLTDRRGAPSPTTLAIDNPRVRASLRQLAQARRFVDGKPIPARGRPVCLDLRATLSATCGRGLVPSLHGTQHSLAFLERELEHHRADRLPVHFDQEVRQHGKAASVRLIHCGQVAVAILR